MNITCDNLVSINFYMCVDPLVGWGGMKKILFFFRGVGEIGNDGEDGSSWEIGGGKRKR